jgi:hypothetical protein
MLTVVLVVLLVLVLLGSVPAYRVNPHYGYGGGLVGLILVILLILLLTGHL